jgi:hypothetical protein
LPAERDEADADGTEELAFVETIRDFGDGIGVDGELDTLIQVRTLTPDPSPIGWERGTGADFGDEGAA